MKPFLLLAGVGAVAYFFLQGRQSLPLDSGSGASQPQPVTGVLPSTTGPVNQSEPLSTQLVNAVGSVQRQNSHQWNWYLQQLRGGAEQPSPGEFLPEGVTGEDLLTVAEYLQYRGLSGLGFIFDRRLYGG